MRSDREAFRAAVEEYLFTERRSWMEFARALGFSREHLSKIMHGKAAMPKMFVHQVIVKLAELRCIHTEAQARRLLAFMDTADFSEQDWAAKPLVDLRRSAWEDTGSEGVTGPSSVRWIQATQAEAGRGRSFWTVPFQRNPFFTGREDILQQLQAQLAGASVAALTQPQAMSGLGGVGKTQIAVEYAYRFRQDYQDIFWIPSATQEALLTSYMTIADLLHLREAGEQKQSEVVTAVKQWLAAHAGWLLIFDNADDPDVMADFLPAGGRGHIVLTTRSQAVGTIGRAIEVETMGMVEACLLLLRRAKKLERGAFLEVASERDLAGAEKIAIAMDFLPLALDQAGAYIEETRCDLLSYFDLYQEHRQALLQRRGAFPTGHPEPVATTWSLSFERVQLANPAAAELLRTYAFLDPDGIPLEVVSKGAQHLPTPIRRVVTNPLLLDEAIKELLKYSLVQRNADVVRMHRLVQAVLKDEMGKERQRAYAQRTVRMINRVFPVEDVSTWSQCQRYLSQAQICFDLVRVYHLTILEAPLLLSRAAAYLQEHALYTEAEQLYRQALAIDRRLVGAEHPETAADMNNLATLLRAEARYSEAELLYQETLSIYELHLGPDHAQTAGTLNDLASLYHAQGKYDEAEQLFKRALAIEQHIDPDSSRTATTLDNLAGLYHDQERYAEAEQLYQQALTLRERHLGSEHPDVLVSLNNLAGLYRDHGEYPKAEALYRQCLLATEQLKGTEHPDTALSLNNLAHLYYTQGEYAEAETLYRRALALRERVLGSEHPNTAISLNNLAQLLNEQGRYAEAEPLFQRALAIYQHPGSGIEPDHQAICLSNLATLYQNQERYAEAEPLFQRALAIYRQQWGDEQTHTASCLNNMAWFYHDQGRYEEAEKLYQQALAIYKQQLGTHHPATALVRKNYTTLRKEMKKRARQ